MKHVLLFFMLCFVGVISQLYAGSEKLLDGFSSTSNFYTPSVAVSIDGANYTEGTGSLYVSYSLNTGASMEVFRSYGTSTLDLSFSSDKLSIQLKGQGTASQTFKFMLYEDQNMNGNPFEVGDEIYEYVNTSVLNNTTWQQVDMPYASFTKFGGGLGTLDLNRIGAWRIVVVNNAATTVASSFNVDELLQVTTYTKPITGNQLIKGSFIQLWNSVGCSCGQYTQAQWEQEFQNMKDLCQESLVVQYGFYDNNAWYEPSSLAYATYSNSTLNRMVAAAEVVGIKLYFGLYFDETWNASDKSLLSSYATVLAKHKEVADELWSLFGTSAAFEGWYIPQEINDLEWQAPAKRTLLANWLRDVSDYVKGKSISKKVLIAPFFGPNRPAHDLEDWWNAVLTTATSIDQIAPQDGVGTTSKIVDVDVPHYFAAIKNACDANDVQFCATVESFKQTNGWPINGNAFTAKPTAVNTLKSQLWEASRFTDQVWQFEWGYMQPQLSVQTTELYNDYKLYSDTYCLLTETIFSKNSSEEILVYPSLIHSGAEIFLRGIKEEIRGAYLINTALGKRYTLQVKEKTIVTPPSLIDGLYELQIISDYSQRRSRIIIIN